MIKVLIIDDEKHGIVTLEKELHGMPDVNIVATVQDSTKAKENMELHQPDLVFLDIEMPRLNGFQVLEQWNILPFTVVFVTAYEQFAIKAFKYNALDYLLKPVDKEDLANCLENYRLHRVKTTPEQLQDIKNIQKIRETIALSTAQGLSFVKVKEIAYFEADTCYTHIIMIDGTKHLVSKSLVNFDFIIEDHPAFFKAHKSFVINLHAIVRYVRGEGGEIIMADKKCIPLSRNKKQEFLSLFHKI